MTYTRLGLVAMLWLGSLAAGGWAQPSRWEEETAQGLRLLDKKDYLGAEQQLRAALQDARALGPLQEARSLTYLGLLYERQDRLVEAKPLYEQALSLRESKLGPDDPEVATSLEHCARVLGEMEQTSEAHELLARAQAIRARHIQAQWGEPPAGEVFRAADCDEPPRLIRRVDPEYNKEARLFRQEGGVSLRAEVRPDGRLHNIRLVRSLGLGLDEQAVEAVRQWRFRPGFKDGRAVIVEALVTVHFRLL